MTQRSHLGSCDNTSCLVHILCPNKCLYSAVLQNTDFAFDSSGKNCRQKYAIMQLKAEAVEDGDDMNAEEAKESLIESFLAMEPPHIDRLKQMCVLPRGLLTNNLRRKVWPVILGIKEEDLSERQPTDELLMTHRDYKIVELDVERLLKRYPPDLGEDERLSLERSLKRIIMRTLFGTDYFYYQGFHDIAITVHLVLRDENLSVAVLRKLCKSHLHVFMMPTLVETVEMLQFIYPLIEKCNPDLHDFLVRASIGTMFELPWLITWYGHNIQENVPYNLVVRLCDLFIATDPYMPVYLGAAIVNSLAEEIFSLAEDQAEVHGFLNTAPSSALPWENLINEALSLHLQFPPSSIAADAATYHARPDITKERKMGGAKKATATTQTESSNWWMTAGFVVSVAVVILAVGAAKYYRVAIPANNEKNNTS